MSDIVKDEKGHSAKFEKINGVKLLVYREGNRIIKTRVVRKVDLSKCTLGVLALDKKTTL